LPDEQQAVQCSSRAPTGQSASTVAKGRSGTLISTGMSGPDSRSSGSISRTRSRAGKPRGEAEAARKQSDQVTERVVEIFRSPDPDRDGRTITVAEMLDQAVERVKTDLNDDPVLQGKLLRAIGETYSGLGLVKESRDVAQESFDRLHTLLGAKHPETLRTMTALMGSFAQVGQLREAVALGEERVPMAKHEFGPEAEWALMAMNCLAPLYGVVGRFEDAVHIASARGRGCRG